MRAVYICEVAREDRVELDGRESYEHDRRHGDVGRNIGGDRWDRSAKPPETYGQQRCGDEEAEELIFRLGDLLAELALVGPVDVPEAWEEGEEDSGADD